MRRMVPTPQSLRYSRPSTISNVEGSERSGRRGGPPAVPRKRSSVRFAAPAGEPIGPAADPARANATIKPNGKSLRAVAASSGAGFGIRATLLGDPEQAPSIFVHPAAPAAAPGETGSPTKIAAAGISLPFR